MSQDIKKLLEYKNLNETLFKVYIVDGPDGFEVYETKDLALEVGTNPEYVYETVIRNVRFCELHNELFVKSNEIIKTVNVIDYDNDDDSDWDDDDDDSDYSDDLSFSPPEPRPTTLDVQNKLKGLTQALSVLPKIKQQVGTWEEKPALENNNDGRLTCYACGEPTKTVDTGFGKPYCVCTACGK
jgi:hypothetical protein